MFWSPHSSIENLGVFKRDDFSTNTSKDYPVYLMPHFIKNGKELTIEDDIKLLMNGGTPFNGFLKSAEEVLATNMKCVNWHYLNLKHISTIYSSSNKNIPLIFNREPNAIWGNTIRQYNWYGDTKWNQDLYTFIKDENLNKLIFTRVHKICELNKKVYPVFIPNTSLTSYKTFLFNKLKDITFTIEDGTTIKIADYTWFHNFEIFTIDDIEYLYINYYAIPSTIDLNNPIAYKTITNIPNYTYDKYNKTIYNFWRYGTRTDNTDDRTYLMFYGDRHNIPKELKDKIVGVTPEKGLPIFDNKDLAKNGFFVNAFSSLIPDDIAFTINGLKTNKTILDIPFAVLRYRKGANSYSYATYNNLNPYDENGNYDYPHNFFNFSDFMYKHPITGELYSLYGFKGEYRNLVINKEVLATSSTSTDNDVLSCIEAIIKPQVINGDYGLSALFPIYEGRAESVNYLTQRTAFDFRPNGISSSFDKSCNNNGLLLKLLTKDAEVFRTQKNKDYIYKDNPHLSTKNSIDLDYFSLSDTFAIFDRVPKNLIDNNNEWDEQTDTRISFDCDGFRDIEALKWLLHIPTNIHNNIDLTYYFNTKIKEMTPINQLVDFEMKYISNQFQNCKIYIVDTKYFNAIGHSEIYKTLLPFRCVFFCVDDMYLYTADNKINKLNPKYFDDNGNFVYDIQQFDKFSIKHLSKVFEVVWDTKRDNNTDFIITEGDTIKYSQSNSPLDYFGTIYKQYTLGIMCLYNLELNTEMK